VREHNRASPRARLLIPDDAHANKNERAMNGSATVTETSLGSLSLVRRGKVRDVYSVDTERLLIVATDRISAFDCILPTQIERKGEVLTQLSRFWFARLAHVTPNHLITTEIAEMPDELRLHEKLLRGRSMLVHRTEVFPVECVVRGYLAGSGWKDYQRTGEICGHKLPARMRESDKLPAPLFTPATKAEEGHDENISESRMREIVGDETTASLRDISLKLYDEAEAYARTRGIIIADTKFEFGRDRDGRIILIDEALTPDSSRFWSVETYEPGHSQASFDKQFVRDYLETLDWDKRPPAPPLPIEVAAATTARYLEAYRLLTGHEM
jgi:phosphoribosylaminoimidazole-succinocarboxamide synthase